MGIYEFKREDAFEFARFKGIKTRTRGDELQTEYCPYCQSRKDKWTFAINLETGKCKCLRASCGITGNMITLSKDFDFSLGQQVDEYYRPRKKYRTFSTPKEPIVPKSRAIEYLESRGISREIAEKYEITVQNNKENVLVFPFYDENGKLQFVKYRKTDYDKDKDSNKEWCEKDCKPILFGMKQCNDKFDRLIICEGQLDSMSVAECGIENAVSVPIGKNGFTWIPYCFAWYSKFEELIVFGDFEHGEITLLDDMRKRFPGRVRHVQFDDYMDCKDANELLLKHGKEAVIKAIENAQTVPVRRVMQFADIKPRDLDKIHKIKTGFSTLDNGILGGGMYAGQVIILTGKRGDGKSTVAGQIMSEALDQGNKVFSYSGELPDWFFKRWLDMQIAGRKCVIENEKPGGGVSRFVTNSTMDQIDAWVRDRFFIYDNNCIEDDELEDLIKTIEKAVMQYGINLVVIDNLMTALDVGMDADIFRGQSKFVKKLAKIAKRLDVAIILIVHPRKNKFSTDENDEVSGSSDITNAADAVWTFKRGKDDVRDGTDTRYLSISKNRWFGRFTKGEGQRMFYDERSMRIVDEIGDFDKQYGWDKSDGFINIDQLEIPF